MFDVKFYLRKTFFFTAQLTDALSTERIVGMQVRKGFVDTLLFGLFAPDFNPVAQKLTLPIVDTSSDVQLIDNL